MLTATTISEVRAFSGRLRRSGKRIGFVPTMGALHEGHLSLVRAATRGCDAVVVSIFVNPTQFGPSEDFSKYPRTQERDSKMLKAEEVDLLFTPAVEEMYPPGATTFINVGDLSERLDGRSRPGHFRGVATVASKLFNIVQPHMAFFGQKDAAQLAVIRRMARDMAIAVEIAGCPTVREADGLAMSSRNVYLPADERRRAPVLYRSLLAMQSAYESGVHDAATLRAAGLRTMATEPTVQLEYLEIVDPDTLEDVETIGGQALVAVAAKVGSTRLIDNVLLPPQG